MLSGIHLKLVSMVTAAKLSLKHWLSLILSGFGFCTCSFAYLEVLANSVGVGSVKTLIHRPEVYSSYL